MFNFFKKKQKVKSCVNCIYYINQDKPKCTITRNSTLRAFPFKQTKCQKYKEK